jgi:hypothetical protein
MENRDDRSDGQHDNVPLRHDPEAESADSSLSAFLVRPQGTPVYQSFPLLEESKTAEGCGDAALTPTGPGSGASRISGMTSIHG